MKKSILTIQESENKGIFVGITPGGKFVIPQDDRFSVIIPSPEHIIFSIEKIIKTNNSIISLFISETVQNKLFFSKEVIEETKYLSIQEILNKNESFEITHLRIIIRHCRIKEGSEFYPQEGRLSNTVQYLHDGKMYTF